MPYLKTQRAVGELIGLAASRVNDLVRRDDFPKRTKYGWSDTAILKWREVQQARLKEKLAAGGGYPDLKRKRLEEQIRLLQVQIKTAERIDAKASGELISMADAMANCVELTGWFRDCLDLWVGEVRVLTGDAKLVKEAERLRDNALKRMEAKCKTV